MSQDYEVYQDAELEHYKQSNDELEAEMCKQRDLAVSLKARVDNLSRMIMLLMEENEELIREKTCT